MIDFDVNGIVLRVNNKALGEVGNIRVMGKSLSEWAGSAIGVPCRTVEGSQVVNLCEAVRSSVDRARSVTVILYCDTPLVTAKTIAAAVDRLRAGKYNSMKLPRGFVFRTEHLFEMDSLYLNAETANGEFDTVVDAESLSRVTDVIRRRILRYHASNGVNIPDFNNTYIDSDAVISRGATVEPYNFIKGKTVIKEGAVIMPNNYIEDCIIGAGARIDSSRLYKSAVGSYTTVGPFAYLRQDSVVGEACRIGDFVELKNCIIGSGTKVSHLSYVGDAQLGEKCNIGCGVVFVNYDGKNKHRAVVGNNVFVGSNANIIAPVTIEDRAFIAAGSTITDSVPKQALAVARGRQYVKRDWKGNLYAPIEQNLPENGGVIDAAGKPNGGQQ